MADLGPTAANVVKQSGTQTATGTYGETVTAGQAIYKKASDGLLYKAQCDGTTAEAAVVGIALNSGSANQPASYATSGLLTLGAVTAGAAGVAVALSATAGGICPDGDIASTNYYTAIGVLTSATVIQIALNVTGVQHA